MKLLNPKGNVNLHTHTVYCDGKDTPEELVKRAIELGMTALGFSGHEYAPQDTDFCMSKDDTKRYTEEVLNLKKKYKDQIDIYLGIERDYFGKIDAYPYDYVIGSLHYVEKDGVLMTVDYTLEVMECDHINHNVSDVRVCNLRNCSKAENLYNQLKGQGKVIFQNNKYIITNFPKEETNGFVFDTELEAYEKLYELQDIYYGEFSYRRSREIAKENETNQFVKRFHYFGILDEIDNLPQRNIYKIILTNIERNKLNGIISEKYMTMLYLQLIDDYKLWKREERERLEKNVG